MAWICQEDAGSDGVCVLGLAQYSNVCCMQYKGSSE